MRTALGVDLPWILHSIYLDERVKDDDLALIRKDISTLEEFSGVDVESLSDEVFQFLKENEREGRLFLIFYRPERDRVRVEKRYFDVPEALKDSVGTAYYRFLIPVLRKVVFDGDGLRLGAILTLVSQTEKEFRKKGIDSKRVFLRRQRGILCYDLFTENSLFHICVFSGKGKHSDVGEQLYLPKGEYGEIVQGFIGRLLQEGADKGKAVVITVRLRLKKGVYRFEGFGGFLVEPFRKGRLPAEDEGVELMSRFLEIVQRLDEVFVSFREEQA